MTQCAPVPDALNRRSLATLPFPEVTIWSGTDALAVLHDSPAALFLARHPGRRFSLGRVPLEGAVELIQALTRCGVPDCIVLIEEMHAAMHAALLLRILHQSLQAVGLELISGLPGGGGAAPADYAALRAMAGTILVGLCASQVLPDTIVPQALVAGPPPRPEPDPSLYEHGRMLQLVSHPQIRLATAGKLYALLPGSEVRVYADLIHDLFRADLVLPDWHEGAIVQDEAGHHVLVRARLFLSPQDAAHYALGLSERHGVWVPASTTKITSPQMEQAS